MTMAELWFWGVLIGVTGFYLGVLVMSLMAISKKESEEG